MLHVHKLKNLTLWFSFWKYFRTSIPGVCFDRYQCLSIVPASSLWRLIHMPSYDFNHTRMNTWSITTPINSTENCWALNKGYRKYEGCWLIPILIMSEDVLWPTDTLVYYDIHPLSPVLVLLKLSENRKLWYELANLGKIYYCVNLTYANCWKQSSLIPRNTQARMFTLFVNYSRCNMAEWARGVSNQCLAWCITSGRAT